MQTAKDAEIVGWIGCLGAAGAEHVIERFATGQSWTYARLSKLVLDGLLVPRTLLYRQPVLYMATAEGLRWRGLERLGVYQVGPGAFHHAQQLATTAVAVFRALPGWRMLSEREIRAQETETGEILGSVKVGELPAGGAALHRPDLLLLSPSGRVVAVEVELSVKAPRRLEAICRGWARARHIDAVYYLAAPAPARALERAVNDTRAEDRLTILPVEEIRSLAVLERQEVSNVVA